MIIVKAADIFLFLKTLIATNNHDKTCDKPARAENNLKTGNFVLLKFFQKSSKLSRLVKFKKFFQENFAVTYLAVHSVFENFQPS